MADFNNEVETKAESISDNTVDDPPMHGRTVVLDPRKAVTSDTDEAADQKFFQKLKDESEQRIAQGFRDDLNPNINPLVAEEGKEILNSDSEPARAKNEEALQHTPRHND